VHSGDTIPFVRTPDSNAPVPRLRRRNRLPATAEDRDRRKSLYHRLDRIRNAQVIVIDDLRVGAGLFVVALGDLDLPAHITYHRSLKTGVGERVASRVQTALNESNTSHAVSSDGGWPEAADRPWTPQKLSYATSRGYKARKMSGSFRPWMQFDRSLGEGEVSRAGVTAVSLKIPVDNDQGLQSLAERAQAGLSCRSRNHVHTQGYACCALGHG